MSQDSEVERPQFLFSFNDSIICNSLLFQRNMSLSFAAHLQASSINFSVEATQNPVGLSENGVPPNPSRSKGSEDRVFDLFIRFSHLFPINNCQI